MAIAISTVFVTQDKIVGTAEAAIKALYSSDFINNGTYPFEADSFVSVTRKFAVFIDDELAKICESQDEAEKVAEKIRKAIQAVDSIDPNDSVSLLNLFEHKEMFSGDDEEEREASYRRVEL